MVAKSATAPVAVEVIEDADAAVAEKVEPLKDTLVVEAITLVSKAGDQPPLRALCAAVIAAGLVGACWPRTRSRPRRRTR